MSHRFWHGALLDEQVGEPEVAAVTAQKPPFAQAAEISEQFAMAAHRHRHPDQAAH